METRDSVLVFDRAALSMKEGRLHYSSGFRIDDQQCATEFCSYLKVCRKRKSFYFGIVTRSFLTF